MRTNKEVFQLISDIQLSGIMFHSGMREYFEFISLHGFKRMHEYHLKCELCEHVKTRSYYLKSHGEILEADSGTQVKKDIVPKEWLRYRNSDVTKNIAKQATQKGMELYIEWEHYVLGEYQQCARDLYEMGSVADYKYVCCLVKDVSKELQKAEKLCNKLCTVDYDMGYVQEIQKCLHDKYKRKMGKD